ncbi:hypothetical protein M0811_00602 [Anaeramoeba ignava]|uniref:Uncharacterized protein n=1 Tax=Anaeramoeba ignava TaxID=1746090 RepID=A0A9Q0LQQ7_ANAIG|nr:hypothetical protein M0811_00602 [Anaeramoeba ignava]
MEKYSKKLDLIQIGSELFRGMFLNVNDSSNQVHDYSGKSFETLNQLIYFFYHDEFDESKLNQEVIEELEDVKNYFQTNQNSKLNLILNRLKKKKNIITSPYIDRKENQEENQESFVPFDFFD